MKRARETRGISLHDMAARTKISITALESLERNDFSRLPGGIFGRAFVRAYAVEVGLDPDASVNRFAELLEQSEREAAERKAAARPEITLDDQQFLQRQQRALLMLRIAIVVVVVAVVAVSVWQGRAFWQRRKLAAAAAAAAAASPAPSDAAPASATPPTVPSPSLVVELVATADCAVSVGVDGAVAPDPRPLRTGERQRVEAGQEVVVDVSDAGAVQLTINGKVARPLGKAGTRARTRITRDNIGAFFE